MWGVVWCGGRGVQCVVWCVVCGVMCGVVGGAPVANSALVFWLRINLVHEIFAKSSSPSSSEGSSKSFCWW